MQPFCTLTLPSLASEAITLGVFTEYASLVLPIQNVNRIKKAVKEQEASFSYTVGAAVALAIYRNSSNQDKAKSVILPAAPTDMRFRLSSEKERRQYIANGIVAGGSVVVPVSLLKVKADHPIPKISKKNY